MIASGPIKGELRNDADQVDGAARQGFAHEAVARADVNDAGFPIRGEIVGVVARDFLTGQREGDAVDADQLPLEAFIHVSRADDEGFRNGSGPLESHCTQVRTDFEQSVVLGDLSCDRQGVSDGGLVIPFRPVCAGVQGDSGRGVLQVAHGTEVAIGSDHTGHRHDVAHTVVGADIEDVVL